MKPRSYRIGLVLIIGCLSILWVNAQSIDSLLQSLIPDDSRIPLSIDVSASLAEIELGRMLFFDKELSGNRDISCATCHHPTLATTDARPLSLGTGNIGLGLERELAYGRRIIPRNAPDLFNLSLREVIFWDGRIQYLPTGVLDTPADEELPTGFLDTIAVQSIFPLTSRDEMRGRLNEYAPDGRYNELSSLPDEYFIRIWDAVMERVLSHDDYIDLFVTAYPDVPVSELSITHLGNALASFQEAAFIAIDSPWQSYLNGNLDAINESAKRGAVLFYGEANCGQCHIGNTFTDDQFYNIGVPQIGPGKNGYLLDYGRWFETDEETDRYAFRTPSLLNVSLTAPYFHSGAYATLEEVIRHKLNPVASLEHYTGEHLPIETRNVLRRDTSVVDDVLLTLAPDAQIPTALSDADIQDIVAFLETLTAQDAENLGYLIPDSVPSGLPIDD